MTVATLSRPTAAPPLPTLRIGQRELTPDQVFRYLSTSKLLPQFVRDIVLEDALQNVSYTIEELNAAMQGLAQHPQYRSLDVNSLNLLALRSLRVEKFKVLRWGNQINSYFLQRRHELDQVVCSLIQTPDTSLVQELYFRIQNQEDQFENLAKQYSQSTETQEGGKLGPIALSQLHPEIARHLRGLKPGQVAPVFILGQQCIIIRLDRFIPAQLTDQLRQTLLNELFENWLERETAKEMGMILPDLIQIPTSLEDEQRSDLSRDLPFDRASEGSKRLGNSVDDRGEDVGQHSLNLEAEDPITPLESAVDPEVDALPDQRVNLPTFLEPQSASRPSVEEVGNQPRQLSSESSSPQRPRYRLAISEKRRSSLRRRSVPIAASIIGGLLVAAGIGGPHWLVQDTPSEASQAATRSDQPSIRTPATTTNLIQPAYDQAVTAATLTQMARSTAQWDQVIQHWQAALQVLGTVPQKHPQFQLAQTKQAQYRRYLAYAEHQKSRSEDSFRIAVEAATAAAKKAQTAQDPQQWLVVADLWKTALKGMEAVSAEHPRYAIAQQRIPIYQANLEYVQHRIQRSGAVATGHPF